MKDEKVLAKGQVAQAISVPDSKYLLIVETPEYLAWRERVFGKSEILLTFTLPDSAEGR
jgi:hypothetical protein